MSSSKGADRNGRGPAAEETRWSLVLGAAEGCELGREEFVRRYESVVRYYLEVRWRTSPLRNDVDDAVQDVFFDCFREQGALTRVDPDRPGGFRAFLYGVVRNVARRAEERRYRARERQPAESGQMGRVEAREDRLSKAFDRGWARAMLRQAAKLQAERAAEVDEDAIQRVELLRLRFVEDRPIRDIASEWGVDAERVHYAYRVARKEFKVALAEIVRQHDPRANVDAECTRLLALLRR